MCVCIREINSEMLFLDENLYGICGEKIALGKSFRTKWRFVKSIPAVRLLPLLRLPGSRRRRRQAAQQALAAAAAGEADEVAADGELVRLEAEVDGLEGGFEAARRRIIF
jgi:hypothetical protein